jgi:outer membrane protein OmpA-like peptidoglycan-associated protein
MRSLFTLGLPAVASFCLAATPAAACEGGLERVFFSSGAATITEDGRESLNFFAVYYEDMEALGSGHHIWLTAHSDAAGSETANLALSGRRAEAVRDYLMHKNIPASHIDIFNLGERAARTRRDDGTHAASDRFVQVELVTREEVARKSSDGRCG